MIDGETNLTTFRHLDPEVRPPLLICRLTETVDRYFLPVTDVLLNDISQ